MKILDFPSLGLVYRTLSPIARIFLQFPPLTAPLGRHHPSILPKLRNIPKPPPFPIPKTQPPSISVTKVCKSCTSVFSVGDQTTLGSIQVWEKTAIPPGTTEYHPLEAPQIASYLGTSQYVLSHTCHRQFGPSKKDSGPNFCNIEIRTKTGNTYDIYHIYVHIYTHGIFNLIFRQAWT